MNGRGNIVRLALYGILSGSVVLAASALYAQPTGEYDEYRELFEILPSVPPIPADNSMTAEKIELGNKLFFEPRISASGIISCATCHNPAMGWTDRISLAVGHASQAGERNTPTVLNSGFFDTQFWDGRAATLEEQAVGPIEDEVEMAMPLREALDRIRGFDIYQERFEAAFPDHDGDPITEENVARALATFQRTLNTPNAPLDRWLAGDENAMSEQQKQGMSLFVEYGCLSCHSGPILSDSLFHRIQVPGSTDEGRYVVTGDEFDRFAFKTPTLRNVVLTYPYFNNGSVYELGHAIEIMAEEMLGIELTEDEVADLEEFMHALTGDMPNVRIPTLP